MAQKNVELIEAITNALWRLDGDELACVALATGFTREELRDLGGLD